MSLSSNVYLGSLRLEAQQRVDLEDSPNLSTPEWNNILSKSYKELYDLLVGAYGNDYFVQVPYQFTINSTQLYPLPADFYKLLGVDIQYSASPTGWVTLKRFEFIDRNKYSWLNPVPIAANLAQLWYIPEPTSLQSVQPCSTTANSAVVGVVDVADLSVGMSAYGNNIPQNVTIVSIDSNAKTVTLSASVAVTQPIVMMAFWRDDTSFDGISGWEEYVIVDAAIKANIKQEQPIEELMAQKLAIKARIEAMAEGRDAGQAHHVSDALSVNTPVISLGATNLKYRLFGANIQFTPCGYDAFDDGCGSLGGGF